MDIPRKKLLNGFELPVYGFGLWLIGGKRDADYSRDEEEIATLRKAIEMGVTHFDTAEGYADGHSEELLGQAIKGCNRTKLFIATKVSGEHQGYNGVKKSLTDSLVRLQTAYVDLYILHSYPDQGISIAETMKAMDELMDQGLIRNIGVSNMTARRFDEAQKYTKHKIVCNQVHYNTQYREAEVSGVLDFCQDSDVMLVAWRPLQKGRLPQSELIDQLTVKYQKTPSQIVLNWLISQDNVVTIAKTSSIAHLKENLGATGWTMDSADIELIRTEFPRQQLVSDAYPLDYVADLPAY